MLSSPTSRGPLNGTGENSNYIVSAVSSLKLIRNPRIRPVDAFQQPRLLILDNRDKNPLVNSPKGLWQRVGRILLTLGGEFTPKLLTKGWGGFTPTFTASENAWVEFNPGVYGIGNSWENSP